MRTASLIFLSLMIWSSVSSGETYKYSDDKGTPCFTDDIKSIPKKYRKNAVLIKEDDNKVTIAPPLQADKIDESLLPQKEGKGYETDEAVLAQSSEPQQNFPYRNVIFISSLFLVTLMPTFFLNNRMVKRILRMASMASILTLLVYVSIFFVSKHMGSLKKDAAEMTEAMKKKEAEKKKELHEVLGNELLTETNK